LACCETLARYSVADISEMFSKEHMDSLFALFVWIFFRLETARSTESIISCCCRSRFCPCDMMVVISNTSETTLPMKEDADTWIQGPSHALRPVINASSRVASRESYNSRLRRLQDAFICCMYTTGNFQLTTGNNSMTWLAESSSSNIFLLLRIFSKTCAHDMARHVSTVVHIPGCHQSDMFNTHTQTIQLK
jgi:uncharacterized phosphosugar-binding protein